MVEDQRPYGLGDALEHAYDHALEVWRRQHANNVSPAELFAGPIINVQQTTLFYNGGRANITISITGRRRHQDEVYFFLLQKRENCWYFQDRS